MKQCMGCMEVYQDNLTKCPICGYEEGTMPENTLHMEPGSVLNNRYIVGKVLGYGGFGVTYIAWDTLLEQKVAIKEFLPSEFATRMLGRSEITIFSGDKHKQFMEGLFKFVEEAKKIAKFNNVSGIVKIFDCIEENNTAYIIMEYLEGETLAVKLEREKKMKPEKAISLLLPIMESLKKVNANGIIHRDIAPDNIFITSKGEPKLIDFGAARYATTSLSRSLTIIIKPGYSPEEQYRSMGDQGSWTDVYSIGATLYKMITGETPCDSMERKAYFEQNHTDMLKPISKFVTIDKNYETAIMNALNIKIQDRTMNMGQLMEELTGGNEVKRVQVKNDRENLLLRMPYKVKLALIAVIIPVVIIVGVGNFWPKKDSLIEKGMTRVPNLQNLEIESAKRILDKAKLKYVITGFTYSTTIPANSVMSQSIEGGKTVSIDTEVELTVSKVYGAHEMSNVLGMKFEKAKKQLETGGYEVTSETAYDDVINYGCVVKQDLDKKEKLVKLVISKGREEKYSDEGTLVPNFVGTEFKDCFRICTDSGLIIEVSERVASNEKKEGEILSQSTPVDYTVKKGTVINITVSKGTDEIELEDFTKWDIEKAREYLEDQGINVEEIYEQNDSARHGEIFNQTPKAGTKIKTGDKVTFNIGIGPDEFEMVSLYNKTEEEAIRIANSYGLKYEIVQGYNANVEEGHVYYQSISKGTTAHVGDKIEIKVSNSEAELELPKMVGEEISNIEKQLNDLGLRITKQKEFKPDVPKNTIISTSLGEGESVKVGDTINIVYCAGKGDILNTFAAVGQEYTSAKASLEEQGFTVKVEFEFCSSVAEGIVISQSIEEQSQASSGDEIEIVVSKGIKPIVTFSANPIEIYQQVTQIYAMVEPAEGQVSWDIADPSIAEIYTTPESNHGNSYYANIAPQRNGKTYIILKIKHIDGSETSYKCRLIIR